MNVVKVLMIVLKSAPTRLDHTGVAVTVDTAFPVMKEHVQISMNVAKKCTTVNNDVSTS